MTALADERCCAVVSFFRDYERYAAGFHHVTLPALAATGVVTDDADERVVRYHGHPEMERLEELLPAL